MDAENVQDFDAVIGTFSHPRYELIANSATFDGEAAVRGYFGSSRTPFPDQSNERIAMHHLDDGVLVEFWLMGTHNGTLHMAGQNYPPSGKSYRVRMAALFFFDDKGITGERVWYDQLSILQQLELLPA
jgi:ketosteroid isomerase-like protein